MTVPASGPLPPEALLSVAEALHTVRHYLDMDVAFVTEFIGDTRLFRYVDSKRDQSAIRVGGSLTEHEGYCTRIVEGTIPGLVPDTASSPTCRDIELTHSLPIGSHLGVPLRLADGQLYGTLCCFNHEADISLNDRDLRLMQMFGALIARRIEADAGLDQDRGAKMARLRAALDGGDPAIVYQPVFSLRDGLLLGAEALARFSAPPARSPDTWFAEAAEVDLQVALEVQAIRNAIAGFEKVWRQSGTMRLAFNASPETILSDALQHVLRDAPVEHCALEITEHERVENYPRLTAVLAPLRQRGCKIAVDDAGSGYASLRHILQLEPEVVKLDISLTRGIDASAGKRALAGGLIEFARQTGCVIIAEGVETQAELATLRGLRVNSAQGYLLGRPAPVADLCRRISDGGRADASILPSAPLAPR